MSTHFLKAGMIVASMAVLVLEGCSAPVGAPPPRFADSRVSRDLVLVLPSAVAMEHPEALAEYAPDASRRDVALGVGAMTGDLGPAYYQGEVPPSIEDVRWFYLSCEPRRVTYFSRGSRHWR